MNIDHAKEIPLPQAAAISRRQRSEPGLAPAAGAVQEKPAPAQPGEVDAAISAVNQSIQTVATNLKFEKDTASGKTVVRVIDSETQQVLRQMPSEEMLAMSKALDRLQGLMVQLKV